MKTSRSVDSHAGRLLSRSLLAGSLALFALGCTADGLAPQTGAQTPPATLLPGAPARAQELAGEIDRIFSWVAPDSPGCTVAASQHGRLVVNRAYGSADLESKAPIVPNSVFDIGSVHKQFIAASILLLETDGRLSLADDIRKHIPELPDYGHTVTIDHLLTHTGGVRDWTALLPLSAEDDDALTAILRQRGLNFAPGEEWSYSNSGFVLLKEIAARVSGMAFGDFARRRLFEPLGMQRTLYSVDMRDDVPNRATAYEKQGDRWTVSMRQDENRGGGGILSTTGDLLIWNEALTNDRLGVTEKLQQQARLNNGRTIGYARALFVDVQDGEPVVWRHGGGAAGFESWLGRLPKPGLSIAILCNAGDTDQGLFARQIVDLLAPEALPPLPAQGAPAPVAPAGPNLDAKAGLFVSEDGGDMLRLAVNDGRLQIAGGPPLVSVDADRFQPARPQLFFRSQDEFELRFLSPDEIELRSMEAEVTRYRRPEPYAPSAADLQGFAGRYESTELNAVFDIAPGNNAVALRLEHIPERLLQFRPLLRDTFQFSQMTIRFHRDAAGNVTALDYSNPVLRKVKFVRLGDAAN